MNIFSTVIKKKVSIFVRNTIKSIQNLQTVQAYISHVLQHLAIKLCNFTKFRKLFNAVVINFAIYFFRNFIYYAIGPLIGYINRVGKIIFRYRTLYFIYEYCISLREKFTIQKPNPRLSFYLRTVGVWVKP